VVVVVAGDDPDEAWLDRVREAVSEAGRTKVVASSDPLAKAADSEVAVVLEPGVLPLPGCIEILAATLASDDAPPAVTGKLIGATGRLEAAGRIVFADGSVAGMGAGRDALFSPWHEYVRPVCAASGLLAVRGTTAESLRSRSSSLLALSGHLWAQGERLLYQPAACAVSVLDSGDEGTADQSDDGIDAWRKALPARPPRPPQLDERAWREILARDDAREAFE